ncbi:hypothetical protein G7054_g8938 [Neopestalotiopsis clavispora]|nr:hypothetical protein G7054_g8938 [Neopestalotiopsis clavispora]
MDLTFKIATSDTIPLIPKNGRIGILEATDFPVQGTGDQTEEDEEKAAQNQDYFNNLPAFRFQMTTTGSSDYYDLVTTVEGSEIYVALDVGTLEIHTSATSQNDPNGLVTGIFTFSCDGHIEVNYLGIDYTWSVGPDKVNTVLVAGSPSDGEHILLVPTTMPPGYDESYTSDATGTLSRRHPRYAGMPELHRRNSPWTDGQLPRVPSSPANLYSYKRDGARDMESNGCGSGSTAGWIPQLNFGHCCDLHDYCFDNCYGGNPREKCTDDYCSPSSWEGCNSAFYNCLHGSICSQYSWIWFTIRRAACECAASFYAWVVTTHFGADAFKEANSERCDAYCPGGNPLCHGQCLTYAGNDNNNCGGCDYKCNTGAHYECQSGHGAACVCNDDQCGNLCVDLQAHPRNCGSCGHVCSTGYCFEGQCVDVSGLATSTDSAPVCYPTDAVKNGGFDTLDSNNNASPWELSNDDTSHKVIYGPSSLATSQPNNAAIYNLDDTGFVGGVYLRQNLTLCPGTTYELTFTLATMDFDATYKNEWGILLRTANRELGAIFLSYSDSTPQGYGPYPFTIPTAPAEGGTGWGANDNWQSIQYDSTGTFAYIQLVFWVVSDDLPPSTPNGKYNLMEAVIFDDVSVYQA